MKNPITEPTEIQSETVQVPISRGYFVTIDKDDYERVTAWKWSALPTKWTVYARRNVKGKNGKQHSLYLHRFIMGDPDGFEIDHRDGNGLNNSKSNLREATKRQSAQNQKKSNRNTSGVKGVHYSKKSQKWYAYICIGKKQINLGFHATREAATAARQAAATLLHRDFVRHE